MKKFREFLNEKNNSSAFIIKRIRNGAIPLSPSTFERIFGDKTGRYLHVLDISKISSLKKISKTKKSISAFSRMESNFIFTGAKGLSIANPCVALLEGKYIFDFNDDVFTSFDSQGRRWIEVGDLEESASFYEDISDLIQDEFKEQLRGLNMHLYELKDNKEIQTAITLYFDITEKILKSQEKKIIKFNKTLINSYNEIVAYDFEIKKILVTKENMKDEDNKDDLIEVVETKDKLIKQSLIFLEN